MKTLLIVIAAGALVALGVVAYAQATDGTMGPGWGSCTMSAPEQQTTCHEATTGMGRMMECPMMGMGNSGMHPQAMPDCHNGDGADAAG